MKCTRCGAEVEAQKFCIYCGERLQPKEVLSVQKRNVKAPSGVMRYRHRSSISNTALPEIQKKQPETAKMQLASLNGSQSNAAIRTYTGQNRFDMDVREHSSAQIGASRPSIARPNSSVRTHTGQNRFEPEIQEQASRQSRELELLLQKLNGSDTSLTVSCEDEAYEDDLLSEDESLKSMASLDVDLDADCDSLNGFFIGDEECEIRDVSGTAPMGSGSFARVPSGGFHLVIDSIKSACRGIVKRIQSFGESRTSSRQMSFSQLENRRKILAIAITGVVLCLMGVVLYFGSQEATEHKNSMEIAAQAPVAVEEPVLDLGESEPVAEETAFEDEVLMPELDFTLEDDEEIAIMPEMPIEKIDEQKVEQKIEIAKIQEPAAPQNNGVKAENRTYGRKDNVLANLVKGNKVKVARSCIMREGPASRFGLVKQIPSGAQIEVLTTTQEDWELQAGGVWTKAGETAKLGPGTQFANAPKGAKLPQPKSRVISASNWKYVKSGDLYGYVGPACFK